MVDENQEIIGTKKSIWFCGHTGLINFFPLSFYENYNEVVIHDPEMYKKNKSRIPNLTLCEQEITDVCTWAMSKFNGFSRVPTTGMLTIFYLLNEGYSDITVCGFDGFYGGHWYGNKYISNQKESDVMATKGRGRHDVIKEHEYFKHLVAINQIKIL